MSGSEHTRAEGTGLVAVFRILRVGEQVPTVVSRVGFRGRVVVGVVCDGGRCG